MKYDKYHTITLVPLSCDEYCFNLYALLTLNVANVKLISKASHFTAKSFKLLG